LAYKMSHLPSQSDKARQRSRQWEELNIRVGLPCWNKWFSAYK